jgi:small subunit ribosomal protein S17
MAEKGKTKGRRKGGARDIGIKANPPKQTCEDPKCPWHGTLPVRGQVTEGRVVSAKAARTAIIEKEYLHFVPKYERYERRKSRIVAYNPDCIEAKLGDVVRIAECRPLSKTKQFVVIEKLK